MLKLTNTKSADNIARPLLHLSYPAVSVVIPMYNAEKYIAECLDSLLAQTFQDFELIVVDDCSTDNSAAIVESYRKNFGDRLILTTLKKNSGNAGYSARNKGFTFARGEYVFFMDADDMVTKTAFEELYAAAKKFDAEVVYTTARYLYTSDKGIELKFDRIATKLKEKNIDEKPTLILGDPHKKLQDLLIKDALHWEPWAKFVQRDFLLRKEITFYEILSGGDLLFTMELLSCSERFLRLPTAIYLWRDDSVKSITREKRSPEKQISLWSRIIVNLAQALTDLENKNDILKQNHVYCYFAVMRHFNFCFFYKNRDARLQVKPNDIYEILRRAMEKDSEFTLLIPFMFSVIDSQQKGLIQAQQQFLKFNQFAIQAQQRIAALEGEIRRLKGQA